MLPRSHEVALAPLLSRRSVSALVGPAPTAQEIDAILQAAVTVPDHGGLRPWRLVVATGEARSAFGDALAATGGERLPDLSEATLQRVRRKAFAAPTLITVVARLDQETRVPRRERVASAACVGYAITLAAAPTRAGRDVEEHPVRHRHRAAPSARHGGGRRVPRLGQHRPRRVRRPPDHAAPTSTSRRSHVSSATTGSPSPTPAAS